MGLCTSFVTRRLVQAAASALAAMVVVSAEGFRLLGIPLSSLVLAALGLGDDLLLPRPANPTAAASMECIPALAAERGGWLLDDDGEVLDGLV